MTNIHIGTMAGKLNGEMPTLTPNGCLMLQLSISVPTFSEYSPFNKCGMPQANSTTSMPRVIEPAESDKILPCSEVSSSASLSISRKIKSLNLKNTLDLVRGGVAAHFFPASTAQSMASFTSSAFANETFFVISPFAGLNTSPNLSDLLICSFPLIN